MKNTTLETNKTKIKIVLWVFIAAYILYFSYFTILRFQTLYASYFDLGIMHQTVFNTYKALVDHDPSRILELTNPFGQEQIKRMAIHNDILLALLAPFYFISASPITLLIIQSVVLGLGALAIFKISQVVFEKLKQKDILSLIFTFCYLLYPPMERANMFEFHAVTLATTLLLFMFYLWLRKKYGWSFLFLVLSLISKEQVGLTAAFFGIYALYSASKVKSKKNYSDLAFPIAVIVVSIGWFLLSLLFIIPYFRGGNHFALGYYGDFGDTPIKVIIGILAKPYSISKYIFRTGTLNYFIYLLGPLGFLSLLSPIKLLIALPELAINLLSNNSSLRSIVFHYTSVIQPFIFISGIYGAEKAVVLVRNNKLVRFLSIYILFFSLIFAYLKGPLPYAKEQEIHPFKYPQKEAKDAAYWAEALKNENLKISTTGQLAPFFTSRRYFYNFSSFYYLADYVVIRPNEVYNYPEKETLKPVYEELRSDQRFELIFKKDDFEVYKKNTI